ncbi:ead/Ea22-like family protein [Salmonella enterica subsp. enterica]|nr:ead/Ea22-like family protein [Salmonella enterica]EBV2435002.1 ead/Ea22-like family protein [Salmonella enterica subsp. enterica serovar Rissen]ECC2821044.1 ead/Ea22-like family protein [Salmonella enterica subsp. enterica]EDE6166902.1 ead/Ea22-like family protein [Salmonella enterica subsp. enterica serovar Stanley]EDG5390902.1 ead/Ea22-like family protein [Salmonella enterica subsp. enterica serovar Bovismorbificans]QVA04093.1 ead/Ea22-like family protein [Salmonella enterica subsp. enter
MTIDKQALRESAERAKDSFIPNFMVPTRDVLALLDELEHYKSREERVTKLVLDNSTSWDALYKKLEAAEKRIAELEARTVNLSKLSVGEVMHMSGFSRDYAEGWCAGNDNAIHEIRTAGIKVKG